MKKANFVNVEKVSEIINIKLKIQRKYLGEIKKNFQLNKQN